MKTAFDRIFSQCINNLQKFFKTKFNFTPFRNRDRDLDSQIDILSNLDLEGMDICYKNNLSKTEQPELLKLINDRTTIIKHADKRAGWGWGWVGGGVLLLFTENYKITTMQHLENVGTYKKFV